MTADPVLTPAAVVPPVAVPAPSSAPLASAPLAIPCSPDARRLASAILDVMAGVTSITDAALALGVTQARYYQLELRAVAGLIAACEPRQPGVPAGASLPAELERLSAERDRLKAEVARYQALLRITQGAFGTAAQAAPAPARLDDLPGAKARQAQRQPKPAAAETRPPPATAKTRKKRTPTVRALRLARKVRDDAAMALRTAASTPATTPGTLPASSAG